MMFEIVVIVIVCASPWFFGAVGEEFVLWIAGAVAGLLALWAVRMGVEGRVRLPAGPVMVCFAAAFLLGAVQLAPLPFPVLSRVAPGTAGLYARLLPGEPEVLEDDTVLAPVAEVGTTVSLYPEATRQALVHFLLVIALFAVVRSNITSAEATKRLAVAVTVNGGLLALFGLVQFFSSPNRGTLYWTFESDGAAFGPFVNRNHFAFYINICIGLALGLLLGRSRRYQRGIISGMLADPVTLWLCGALALMGSSVVFCLSRGGFLALLGAGTMTLLAARSGRHGWAWGAVLVSIALGIGLLVWFGLEQVEARLATLWSGEAFEGGRALLLSQAWPLVRDFPLWGTGYGTFAFVEPLGLHTAADVGSLYEHAHNDYLEDLIEGGVLRLGIRVVGTIVLLATAYRAFRRSTDDEHGGLALGSLFALTTVAIHSAFEFGLFVPAIAVLATVVAGHICLLRDHSMRRNSVTKTEGQTSTSEPTIVGYGGVAAPIGIATVLFVGWILVHQTYYAWRVDRLRSEARDARGLAFDGELSRATELLPLLEAVEIAPRDGQLAMTLAEAYFGTYEEMLSAPAAVDDAADGAVNDTEDNTAGDNTAEGAVDDAVPARGAEREPASVDREAAAEDQQAGPDGAELAATDEQRVQEDPQTYLFAGIANAVRARDLCPLLAEPHVRIGFYVDRFARADPRGLYFARAKLVAPADAQLWYLCGAEELKRGDFEQAFRSWRRSLALSDEFRVRILDESRKWLTPEQIAQYVLPPDPAVVLAAARHLFPLPEDADKRRPLLQLALTLFDNRPELSGVEWHTRSVILGELGRIDEAIEASRTALVEKPLEPEWRYQYAQMLDNAGREEDALRELRVVLASSPRHAAARKLAEKISRAVTERRLEARD